jgi:hypothetical protein
MSNLDKQQSDLMAELRAYREQHTSLAELVGSTGVLQETLYRQKHELLQKFEVSSYINQTLTLLIWKANLDVNMLVTCFICISCLLFLKKICM